MPDPKKLPASPLRLTRDVLAHLRSVAEGFPVASSARRYLDCSEDSAVAVHRAAVDMAAAVARRAGLGPRWRLLRDELAALSARDLSHTGLWPLRMSRAASPTRSRTRSPRSSCRPSA